MNGKIIKICICSFLAGIFLQKIIFVPFPLIFQVVLWCFVLGVFFRGRIYLYLLLGILFVFFGILRAFVCEPVIDENSVHFYRGENIQISLWGIIVDNPDRRRDKVNYIVSVNEAWTNGNRRAVRGRILISSSLYPAFNYGDQIKISGFLTEPVEFESFSYKNYLSLYSVYSVMYRPKIELLSGGKGNDFFAALFRIKDIFEEQLNKIFPEPMASFQAGLLTGSRKGIPDDLMNTFNLTGLTHIIAISGYNISLIVVIVSSFFKNSPRKVKIPVIILFIILFTLFVGASAAVVRASVMGIIAVLALWFGRQSQVINALLFSAFFMVLFNPNTLIYDVGFQLSFLATLGLILTGSHIQKFFGFVPEIFGLREAFAMTLSAQVFALPVILLNFKRFSLISPLANVFVAPFIPFSMFFGFVSTVLSFFWFSFGFIISLPGYLFLGLCIIFAEFFAKLPFASYEVQWFSLPFFFVYYFLFIVSHFVYVNFGNIKVGNRRLNT